MTWESPTEHRLVQIVYLFYTTGKIHACRKWNRPSLRFTRSEEKVPGCFGYGQTDYARKWHCDASTRTCITHFLLQVYSLAISTRTANLMGIFQIMSDSINLQNVAAGLRHRCYEPNEVLWVALALQEENNNWPQRERVNWETWQRWRVFSFQNSRRWAS